MGKTWYKQNAGGRGGGKQGHDLPSCKGFPVVMATCDAGRERESSKELVNLFQDSIEQLYPELADEGKKPQSAQDRESMSFEQLMQAEIQEVREQKHSFQKVHSIQTNVKGIVLVKILSKEVCPVRLTVHVFNQIKQSGHSVCRHLVRIIPLQCVFYPNGEDFSRCFDYMVNANMGVKEPSSSLPEPSTAETAATQQPASTVCHEEGSKEDISAQQSDNANQAGNADESICQKRSIDESAADTVDSSTLSAKKPKPTPTPLNFAITPISPSLPSPFSYSLLFKSRNSNSLSREVVYGAVGSALKSRGGYVYSSQPALTVIVEALKNIAGIAWIRGKKAGGGELAGYEEFEGFNIRKWQSVVCSSGKSAGDDQADSSRRLQGVVSGEDGGQRKEENGESEEEDEESEED